MESVIITLFNSFQKQSDKIKQTSSLYTLVLMKRAVEPIIEATSLKKKKKQRLHKLYCINYLSVFLNFSEIEKSKDLNKNCHLNIKNAKNH